jgi:hypothetical protein
MRQKDTHRQDACEEYDFPRQALVEYLALDKQAVPQHQIEKSPEYVREVRWESVSQGITKWRRELLTRDSVGKVSEGIGEKRPAEKAYSIIKPSIRGSSLIVITTPALKETRTKSNQQDNQGNCDEHGC